MINIKDELKQDFLIYASEVNNNRAFPDARDGLKPGMRAALWEMFTKGYSSSKPHVKSAKVTGGTIATYWPHGDSSIYEAVVRMSQDWINNIPEIDFHGANGSLLGGPDAASSRYTECRLSKAVEEGFFSNITKNTVNMIDNFSEDEKWPEVFPAIFPRLFINGSQGIGYTIAQTWLPNNLIEFVQKVVEFINTGKVNTDNIFPDFPSGGIIINKDDLANIYNTGTGSVILRGKTEIVDNKINITELPYQVYAEPFIQKIKDLVNNNAIKGIEDICNKSDDNGLFIEIECSDKPIVVLNQLYKLTDLQVTFNANQMALVKGVPTMLNLEGYIKVYVEHNIECIKREYKYELDKASARLEILEGLLRALSMIDNIIATIKAAKSSELAKIDLVNNFNFTQNQAKAIVEMRLGRLANLEHVELEKEKENLDKVVIKCNKILASVKLQDKELISRLQDFTTKYGKSRKTEVINVDLLEEKTVVKNHIEKVQEEFVIALTKGNMLKRINKLVYKPQKKVLTENDKIIMTVNAFAKDRVVLIGASGLMYKVQVNKIDLCTVNSVGMPVEKIINDKIVGIFNTETELPYMFFITKNGLVKKMESKEVLGITKLIGTQVIKLIDDEVVDCRLIDSAKIEYEINGKKKILDTDKFNKKGRSAGGVIGIKLTKGKTFVIAN